MIVKTDSASARDLLDASDVPRRSRHTDEYESIGFVNNWNRKGLSLFG